MKAAFHPSPTPWKSLRGFPHSHGYAYDYHVSEDRQSPPQTRNQSHSRRKGLVNHVLGLKRKGCPGTLIGATLCAFFSSDSIGVKGKHIGLVIVAGYIQVELAPRDIVQIQVRS